MDSITRCYNANHGITCNINRLNGTACDNPVIRLGFANCNHYTNGECNMCSMPVIEDTSRRNRKILDNQHRLLCSDCRTDFAIFPAKTSYTCNKCSPIDLCNRTDKKCGCYNNRAILLHAQYNDMILLCKDHQNQFGDNMIRMMRHHNELISKLVSEYRGHIYYDDHVMPYEFEYLYDGIVKMERWLDIEAGQVVKLFKPLFNN